MVYKLHCTTKSLFATSYSVGKKTKYTRNSYWILQTNLDLLPEEEKKKRLGCYTMFVPAFFFTFVFLHCLFCAAQAYFLDLQKRYGKITLREFI